LDAQLRDLKAHGCERVFSEQVSSVAERAELESAIDFCRDRDVLVITKLCRLARSVAHLIDIVARLERKGVALRILDMNIDTSTPTGKLLLNVVGSIGQFEREIMLERQREGIAKAAAEGKYKGRKPTARAKADEILRLTAEGMTREAVAAQLGIGVASVYRILAERKAAA
jgi:DNA invertase Pin-like site-specific DNA recombinase